jgi:hypothetical protein
MSDRDLMELFRDYATKLAGECDTCKGRKVVNDIHNGVIAFKENKQVPIHPCPSCAELRTIAGWKWEENWQLPSNPIHDKDAIISIQKSQNWLSTARAKLVSTIHAKDLDEIARRIDCKIMGFQIVDKGYSPNPTFTVKPIKATLKTLGLWERFKDWLCRKPHSELNDATSKYDVITDDNLCRDAAISFMKEVE